MPKVKIEPQQLETFVHYLRGCLVSDVKSIDVLKEYVFARLVQDVYYRCLQLQLKYQQQRIYTGTKSLSFTDIEAVALSLYFSRYEVPNYLMPLQHAISETSREDSVLINVLTNNVKWESFLNN